MAENEPAEGARTQASLDPRQPLSERSAALGPGRLLALYELGRQLLEQREPDEVLRTVHQAIVTQLRPDQACLLSANGDDDYAAVLAHNLELDAPRDEWPLSWTVVRQVRERGLALLASDVQRDERLREAGSLYRFRIRSVMCVPLGRPPRGVLYAANRSERPFTTEDLEFLTAVSLYASLVLERTEEHARDALALRQKDEHLDALRSELLRGQIIGASASLLEAYDALRRFAKAGARVLLRGETGTGKELFARAYAASSPRARGPYVPVTIPALAPTLVESELFGHVRGAFTEARGERKGRLEIADGGVLFLDEVGDIDPAVQTKLLRFLDSGELYRVGDNQPRRVDTLVVSATNRPLEKDVRDGRFRADLLARLGHAIAIPPLRDRPDDVLLLVEHFLARYDPEPRRKKFADATVAVLRGHSWPFNVRELQQVVERAVCLVDRDVVLPEDLPEYLRGTPPLAARPAEAPRPLREVVDETERHHILAALEYAQGNRRKAIELLGIAPETFYRRLEQYGIPKKD
jgi:transcriptional regulator with GAF, ATPase, and Fis domain